MGHHRGALVPVDSAPGVHLRQDVRGAAGLAHLEEDVEVAAGRLVLLLPALRVEANGSRPTVRGLLDYPAEGATVQAPV